MTKLLNAFNADSFVRAGTCMKAFPHISAWLFPPVCKSMISVNFTQGLINLHKARLIIAQKSLYLPREVINNRHKLSTVLQNVARMRYAISPIICYFAIR
ncbi:hypothetical protein B5F78_05085 [Bacteroides sp. An279]|nr:hypothetical protein B5F78_05085 [Bacteroides sp. An279]